MAMTFEEYMASSPSNQASAPVAPLGANADPYRDVYSSSTSDMVQLPATSSDIMANRESMTKLNFSGIPFGEKTPYYEDDEDGYLNSIGVGIEDFVSGGRSQVHGVVTRFPAILFQEFSDLVGDKADQFPDFAQDIVNGLDDIADEFAQSLMDDYRQGVADNGWAFTEDNQPSFMFKMGSGSASLVEAIGITLLFKNPAVAAVFFGALQQTDTYASAIQAGKTPQEAFAIASTAGVVVGLLERIGLKAFMSMAGNPAKKALARAVQGFAIESMQEASQEGSVIGIENITGVSDVGLRDAFGRIGESALIGGILGGVAGPVTGGIVDKTSGNAVRSGKLDPKIVSNLIVEIEHEIRNNISIEKESWADSQLDNPTTDAGKRLKKFQAKLDEIVKAQANGQDISEVFKTKRQQEEFTKNIVTQMQSATKLESKIIQASKIKDIKQGIGELNKLQSELEVDGTNIVSDFAESFDESNAKRDFLKTQSGKTLGQSLLSMKRELRKVVSLGKKEEDGSLGKLKYKLEAEALQEAIDEIQLIENGDLSEYSKRYTFKGELNKLKKYQETKAKSDEVIAQIEEKIAEHKEWAERADMPEVFDFIGNERITMGGHAMYKISREQSIKSFTDGLAKGQEITEATLIDTVNAVGRIIKSMPFNKGKILNKSNKDGILKELNKMKDRLTSKKFSRAELETQVDIVADMLNDMMEVSKNMTSEGAYQAYKSELGKLLKAKAPSKKTKNPRTLDADLNSALSAMQSMQGKNLEAKYAEFSETGANPYRQVVDSYYQLRVQEESVRIDGDKEVNVLSDEKLAESYAATVDGVEWLVQYGYVPDANFLRRAAEIKAVKDIMSKDTVEMGQKRLDKVRKSPLYAIQDSLFNPGTETLNTLWVKLGVHDIEAFDLTRSDMGKRNAMVEWEGKFKAMAKKLSLSDKDIAKWSELSSEQQMESVKQDGTRLKPMTKGQIMHRVMALRNKEQRAQAMNPKGMAYTEELIAEMEDSLTETERLFIKETEKIYAQAYDKFAPVYKRLFLMDMPKVKNYAPAPKRGKNSGHKTLSDVQFLGANGLALPSFTKSRVNTDNEFMDVGIQETLNHYIESMEHAIHYQERLSNINNIIKDDKVSQSIKQRIGNAGYKRLNDHLEYLENQSKSNSELRVPLWDYFNKVYIVNNLMFHVNQIFKQLSSGIGLMEDIPLAYSIPRLAKLANPISIYRWRKILREHETIRNRSKHIDADYNAIIDNETIGLFSKENKLVKWGMRPTVIGDVFAIYGGGGMYYDYLMSLNAEGGSGKKHTHEEALDIVARKAEMSQQSSLPSNMSLLQKNKNPFARTIRMFSSASIALMNMQVQSFTKWRSGEISKGQFFKNMAIYQIAIPSLYALMAGQISFDDEDELKAGLIHASLKGNFASLPMVGEGLDALALIAVNSMTDSELRGYGLRGTENPISGFIAATIAGINIALEDGDFTDEDGISVLLNITDSVSRVGSDNLYHSFAGLAEFIGDGSLEGALGAAGYGDNQIETITGTKRK